MLEKNDVLLVKDVLFFCICKTLERVSEKR